MVNGKAKEQLDKMEKEIDAASSDDDFDKLTAKFPRGGIMAVLENCPSDHDQGDLLPNKNKRLKPIDTCFKCQVILISGYATTFLSPQAHFTAETKL